MAAVVAEEASNELFESISTTLIWENFVGTEIGEVPFAGISSWQCVPSFIDEE